MGIASSAKVMTFVVTMGRERAKGFYRDTLGFRVTHEDDFAVVFDLDGVMLRISEDRDFKPQPHTILGWEVPDIRAAVTTLRHKGVAFNRYDGLAQDEFGIWASPDGTAQVAWMRDCDGNVLSLTQFG
jgi:catechol 2,3-dioxygenase-like lactoylglutathione lyase family enzyme